MEFFWIKHFLCTLLKSIYRIWISVFYKRQVAAKTSKINKNGDCKKSCKKTAERMVRLTKQSLKRYSHNGKHNAKKDHIKIIRKARLMWDVCSVKQERESARRIIRHKRNDDERWTTFLFFSSLVLFWLEHIFAHRMLLYMLTNER